MLTGTLNATGGDAVINGKSIRTEMGRIRESLGICPQFDVLWPMLTCASTYDSTPRSGEWTKARSRPRLSPR